MEWLFLVFAGGCEVVGVWAMKAFAGRKKVSYFLFYALSFGASMVLLTLSFKAIPTSTAYAVWTGLGATGSTIMGIIVYKEPKEYKRILFISIIIIGVIGLKIFS